MVQNPIGDSYITNFKQNVEERCKPKPKPYEDDCTTEPLLESTDDKSARRKTQIIISLVAFMGSCDVLCSLSINYMYKDDLKVSPAWISFVLYLPKITWTFKPLLCILCDNYPIFGSRRKSYMIIGCLINLISCILIALSHNFGFALITFLFGIWNFGSALCSIAGEALVVEVGRHKDDCKAMNQVSIYFAFRRLSISLMSYGSSVLLLYVSPKDVFWVATLIPLTTLIGVLVISEPSKYNVLPRFTLKNQYKAIKLILSDRRVYNPILFLFITSMAPSASPAMFYFMTEKLHFSSEIFGRANLFQCFASLISIYLFNKYCQNVNLRHILVWSITLSSPFYLMPILLVERWNLKVGIPDTVFAVTDSIICEFVNDFNCIPLMIMTARLCPRGLESTVNSIIGSILNHGLWTGTIICAVITTMLGITRTNYANMKWLIIIATLGHVLPILMIQMLPTKLPTSKFVDNLVKKLECKQAGKTDDNASVYTPTEQP